MTFPSFEFILNCEPGIVFAQLINALRLFRLRRNRNVYRRWLWNAVTTYSRILQRLLSGIAAGIWSVVVLLMYFRCNRRSPVCFDFPQPQMCSLRRFQNRYFHFACVVHLFDIDGHISLLRWLLLILRGFDSFRNPNTWTHIFTTNAG